MNATENPNVLVTGGLGYIGSHTMVELIERGYNPLAVDNLCNSSVEAAARIEQITGRSVRYAVGDVRDTVRMTELMRSHEAGTVMHFAALKAVGESVERPVDYYDNNVNGTLSLLKAIGRTGVKNIIFSSSATVYGNITVPAVENMTLGQTTNPYGTTKAFCERILADVAAANPGLSVTILRYFNPVGAHISGLIGEAPGGQPNNLMPIVSRVALGRLARLSVYGNDYPTPDGTCIRDYIHVVDLAKGHTAALSSQSSGVQVYNLGTGTGSSVLEVIKTFESVNYTDVPYVITGRRNGDLAAVTADASKAASLLKWRTQYSLADMCRDAWRWQISNPNGYGL